jgi:hypothetical protein
MAFTAEQELSIVKIMGITPSFLDAHLASLGAALTADIEAAVITELDRWETAGAGFVKLHPKESNKGVETYPDAEKGDIRRNIAALLELYTYSAATAGMGTLQIGR